MIPKFRGWDKTHQKLGLIDADISDGVIQSVKIFDDDEDDWQEPDNFILMQSTGLTDKNGVEVFEGDVIECTHQNGTTFNGVVTYDEKNAFWGVTDHRYKELSAIPAFNGYLSQVATCEVAGNAYENPELVEVE